MDLSSTDELNSLPHGAALRIIDASANRAREGLRVAEDYLRFARNDAAGASVLKAARHDLTAALAETALADLLASRDVRGDVGIGRSVPHEIERGDLASVAFANLKRAQEALRTLEETSKLAAPPAAPRFASIRYSLYAIEARILPPSSASERLTEARLYWLVEPGIAQRSLSDLIASVTSAVPELVVQLRTKAATDREWLTVSRAIRPVVGSKAILIVNDRVDIAVACVADGVHVGQDDLPIDDVRRLAGNRLLVGVSTHNIEQVDAAVAAGADYIGVGPVFPSQTKTFDSFPGLDFVAQVAKRTTIPAFCIGGIDVHNLPQVLEAGGTRIAVGRAITAADDPPAAARRLADMLKNHSRKA